MSKTWRITFHGTRSLTGLITHSLTNPCFGDLIYVTIAEEDASSKVVNVVADVENYVEERLTIALLLCCVGSMPQMSSLHPSSFFRRLDHSFCKIWRIFFARCRTQSLFFKNAVNDVFCAIVNPDREAFNTKRCCFRVEEMHLNPRLIIWYTWFTYFFETR